MLMAKWQICKCQLAKLAVAFLPLILKYYILKDFSGIFEKKMAKLQWHFWKSSKFHDLLYIKRLKNGKGKEYNHCSLAFNENI